MHTGGRRLLCLCVQACTHREHCVHAHSSPCLCGCPCVCNLHGCVPVSPLCAWQRVCSCACFIHSVVLGPWCGVQWWVCNCGVQSFKWMSWRCVLVLHTVGCVCVAVCVCVHLGQCVLVCVWHSMCAPACLNADTSVDMQCSLCVPVFIQCAHGVCVCMQHGRRALPQRYVSTQHVCGHGAPHAHLCPQGVGAHVCTQHMHMQLCVCPWPCMSEHGVCVHACCCLHAWCQVGMPAHPLCVQGPVCAPGCV